MNVRIAPTLLLSLLLTIGGFAVAQTPFTDNFEPPAINPFWTIVDQAGAGLVNLDTAFAHTGTQSVQVNTDSFGGVEALRHSFSSPINGTVSVWVYYSNMTGTGYKQLDIFDGPGSSGSDYLMYIDWGDLQTYVRDSSGATSLLAPAQSTGWHEWTISSVSSGVTIKIDDVKVFTQPVTFAFGTVNLQQCCLAGSAFFDDFSFTTAACPVDSSNVRFFTSTFGFKPVMAATFVPPNGVTLADYASNCGFKAFDWQQQITTAPCPSAIHAKNPTAAPMCPDGSVGSVSATLPFNDPPQGGYVIPAGDPFPFYYPFTRAISEEQSPTGACILVSGLNCIPLVSSDGKTLAFFDAPSDPCLGILFHIYCTSAAPPASFLGFTTSLVGINPDNTPSDPLFHWSWTDTFNGLSGGIATTFNDHPPDPGSGTGGITITSINGVPQTSPNITCVASPTTLWPPNGKSVSVTVSGTVTAGTQTIPASGTTFAVTDEYGLDQPTGSIAVGASSNYSFTVPLIAARAGSDLNGRTYTIDVFATDAIGNIGSCAVVVTVPHDQGH